MILHKLLREQVLDERSFEERLRSLENNNFILQQRIQTLEGENERLAATIREKNGENVIAVLPLRPEFRAYAQFSSLFENPRILR